MFYATFLEPVAILMVFMLLSCAIHSVPKVAAGNERKLLRSLWWLSHTCRHVVSEMRKLLRFTILPTASPIRDLARGGVRGGTRPHMDTGVGCSPWLPHDAFDSFLAVIRLAHSSKPRSIFEKTSTIKKCYTEKISYRPLSSNLVADCRCISYRPNRTYSKTATFISFSLKILMNISHTAPLVGFGRQKGCK